MPPTPGQPAPAAPSTIEATFRNGSLTAMSVLVGFSLSFLNRWAALPGTWQAIDLVAVGLIAAGIVLQTKALADMLLVSSLVLARYKGAVRVFLVGLVLVGVGMVFAIAGDILGVGQRILGS